MNEHGVCDPLFFKGQMAARYKERMSMGFALANSKKGDEMSVLASSNHSSPVNVEDKLGAIRDSDNSGRAPNTRAHLTTRHLCPSRSKSSLDEHKASDNKPSMKDLITKFESRSLTSGKFKLDGNPDEDRQRIPSDVFGTGYPRLLIDLDPAAVICSSPSDVDNSKSSPSLCKPPHVQISRGALSLNGEPSIGNHERLLTVNRPTSELARSVTLAENSFQKAANSQRLFMSRNSYNLSALDKKDVNTDTDSYEVNQEQREIGEKTALANRTGTQVDLSGPLRVSLRGAANRKKMLAGSKYVVHKKDWAKRLPVGVKETGSNAIGLSTNGNSSQELQSGFNEALSKDDAPNTGSIDRADISSRASDHLHPPRLSSTQLRLTTRSSSRQSDKLCDDIDKATDDKQRTKAMERYLHFLRSNNISQQNNTTDTKPTEKYDQRKAQRPPTPHRLLHLRKGNNAVQRGSFHQIREINQSTSTQDDVGATNTLDRDAKTSQVTRRAQRWKLLPTTDKKDLLIDSSGGDFYANAPISSSNSLDSSVYEYQNNTSPNSRSGLPKLETSDIRFTRFPTKQKSKLSTLINRSSGLKGVQKGYQIRSQSARTHEAAEKKYGKQPFSSSLRGRSSSASKTPDSLDAIKTISMTGMSPKSVTSASSNPMGPPTHNSPSNNRTQNGKRNRSLRCDASDIGSVILTEDELADNDLMPIHLREKKIRDQFSRIPAGISSSNDSCSRRSVTPLSKFMATQFTKQPKLSNDKRPPANIDKMDPFFFDKNDGLQTGKQSSVNQDTKLRSSLRSSQERRKLSDYSKLFALHAKGRSGNTPTKNISRETSFDDSSNHRNGPSSNSRGSNVPLSSHTKLSRTSELPNALLKKDSNLTKDSLNLATGAAQNERRGSSISRENKDRRIVEDALNFSEHQSSNRKSDNFQAAGEGSLEKVLSTIHSRTHDLPRESPTKKTFRQFLNGQTPSALKHLSRERMSECLDTDALREMQYLQENALNLFHFGQNDGKQCDNSEPDTKTEKISSSSPTKKKRKADQPKKTAKRKRKVDSVDEDPILAMNHSMTVPKMLQEKKTIKEKHRELSKMRDDIERKAEGDGKPDKCATPVRRRSSTELCSKSHQSSRKDHSLENSGCSNATDSRTSHRKEICSTSDRSPQGKRALSTTSTMLELRTMPKRPCEMDFKPPPKSQIPLLILSSSTCRRKLDRLIQYRRWREAMLDCLRPSKLPLSESFRKTLDSAVMEEWAMHCWQPSKDMYVDSQGVWWSASYQEVESPGGIPESFLSDGRPLSKEWLLDLTARLPYMKLGPVRFLHAAYVFVAAACLTLGHMGVQLYHCGGDDYEYYCPDDDLECLMEMFSHNIR